MLFRQEANNFSPLFFTVWPQYFMKENIQWVSSPENISTSSLWISVQNLTVDVLFSHVDHASADKCRCSSGDCGVCVVMVRFGRCCCWVHGVAAPRLNLPELQTQLLAEGLQIPEGTSRFLKVAPHLDFCPEHGPSLGHRLSHCY